MPLQRKKFIPFPEWVIRYNLIPSTFVDWFHWLTGSSTYLYWEYHHKWEDVEKPWFLLENPLTVDKDDEEDADSQEHRLGHDVGQLLGNVQGRASLILERKTGVIELEISPCKWKNPPPTESSVWLSMRCRWDKGELEGPERQWRFLKSIINKSIYQKVIIGSALSSWCKISLKLRKAHFSHYDWP